MVAKAETTLEPGVGIPDRALSRLLDTPPRTFRAWVRDHAGTFTR
ncbi:MAG: hypothetical protein QOE59_2298 [Actinomycetota bacterium]|nr:hypothetical protein [Actinomycetota bacterium]